MTNQDTGITVVSIFNTKKCVQMSFRLFTYLQIKQATVGHGACTCMTNWPTEWINEMLLNYHCTNSQNTFRPFSYHA